MDGLEEMQSVIVIGATNRPTLMDPALLRPGRFDELVYVTVPDLAGRRRILGIHTSKMPLGKDVDLDDIAERTDRYSGADLEDLVRRAGLFALREGGKDADEVRMSHFSLALEASRATVSPEMEAEYRAMESKLKQAALVPQGMGFVTPGMIKPTRASKHEY
jgi:transitional endoplasmic reticulum ATPase